MDSHGQYGKQSIAPTGIFASTNGGELSIRSEPTHGAVGECIGCIEQRL
jgi:hypothetical protein